MSVGREARFRARWVDGAGVERERLIQARDRAEALAQCGRERPSLIELREVTGGGWGSLPDVVQVLARLTRRGIPLAESLRAVGEQGPVELRKRMQRAERAASEGASVAEVLQRAGGAFADPFVLGLLRTGERLQQVPAALEQLAELWEHMASARARVLRALMPPLLTVWVGLALCVGVIEAAGPSARLAVAFEPEFAPWAVHALGWLSLRMQWVWGVAAGAALGLIGLRWGIARRLRPPAAQGALREALALRVVGSFVSAGAPLHDAWEVLRAVTPGAGYPDGREGRSAARTLWEAGAIQRESEVVELDEAEAQGPEALGEVLREMGEARVEGAVRRLRRQAAWVEYGVLVGVGVCVALVLWGLIPRYGAL